jgi:RimJ/RimL family protein N-acetyltransferase
MLETERLILRPYSETDREDFAALNGDPQVGAWLAGILDRSQSDALMDRINTHIADNGFGLWGLALKDENRIVGFCGLTTVKVGALPVGPCIEMGWRLMPHLWGHGLASEGAHAALQWGFTHLKTEEVLAFTATTNLASQGVMRKIGMVADPARDFDHPSLSPDHPLRRHVVYAAHRSVG